MRILLKEIWLSRMTLLLLFQYLVLILKYLLNLLLKSLSSNCWSHMVTVLIVYVTEGYSTLSQLLNDCCLLLFVVEVVVPCCLADEEVLPHNVVLIVVSLPEEIKLGFEVWGYYAADAGSRKWNVLSFLIVFQDVRDFHANISKRCVILVLKSDLNEIWSILGLEEAIYVSVARTFYLTFGGSREISSGPRDAWSLRCDIQVLVLFIFTHFSYVSFVFHF